MSFHVYVAREGFKENPIAVNDWITAVRNCDNLVVGVRKNRMGIKIYTITLKHDRKRRIALTPHGLVHAQNPSREMVDVMFELARNLNGAVYSERLKPYASVEDWERRTKEYRARREERIQRYRQEWYKRKPFWIIIAIIAGLVLGYLL